MAVAKVDGKSGAPVPQSNLDGELEAAVPFAANVAARLKTARLGGNVPGAILLGHRQGQPDEEAASTHGRPPNRAELW